MPDKATDGSSHHGDPSRGQWTDGEATPGYSTNAGELLNDIGSQFSDPQHQYTQRDQAGRLNRGDVYGQRGYTERYERTQQPARSGLSRDSHQQQRQLSEDLQVLQDRRRLEEQRLAERQLHEYCRYEERLAAQRSANREQYTRNDPKGEDEVRQSRRRKPR